MKRNFKNYLRCLVGSHKYSENLITESLVQHQRSLDGLTVREAIKTICEYTDTYQDICCLYVTTAFMMRFHYCNIRFGYSPEPNPLCPMPNRLGNKVVAVIDNTEVFDIVSMVAEQTTMSFDELMKQHCGIPIQEYIKRNLLPEEEFVVLPSIEGHENEDFIDFFSNKIADFYSLD